MKEKDADLNRRVLDAASALSSCDPSLGLIYPKGMEAIRQSFKDVRRDALRYNRSIPHALGFADKELKANISIFLQRFDYFPEVVREHNIPLMKKRLDAALSEFSRLNLGQGIIMPLVQDRMIEPFTALKRELLDHSKEHLHIIGLDDPNLKADADRFLKQYDYLPVLMREHNIPILKRILVDASAALSSCGDSSDFIPFDSAHKYPAQFKKIKDDLIDCSDKYLHWIGTDDKSLKNDLDLFLRRYENYPRLIVGHNQGIMRKRITNAAKALTVCDQSFGIIEPGWIDSLLVPYDSLKHDLCDETGSYFRYYGLE